MRMEVTRHLYCRLFATLFLPTHRKREVEDDLQKVPVGFSCQ